MTDQWEVPPPANLDDRVKGYLRRASKLDIKPELVGKYARIVIAAEEIVAHREREEQAIRDNVSRVAAGEHGTYPDDPVKARKAYASARMAQQKLHASASGCSKRLAVLEELLGTHYQLLNIDVAARFPLEDIIGAAQVIRNFASATALGKNLANIRIAKSELSLTVPGHTFMWWRVHVPRYNGRSADMYALAQCWRLTDAKDLEVFERLVKKLKPTSDSEGVTWILGCPPWALL